MIDQPRWVYPNLETAYENKQQIIDLSDTICHNRYGHTGPDYGDYPDLCAAGKTGLV